MPFGGLLTVALIGAGASVYGSHQANKNAKQLQKKNQPLLDQQQANLKLLQPYIGQFMQNGQQNMDITQGYLRNLASGNRGLTMQTMAPEINTMAVQSQGSASAARNLFPRGGGSAAATGNIPYQLQGNINNMLFSARPQAMQALGALGGNQASLGLGAAGQSGGLTNNMLNYGLNAQNQTFNQGAAIGQGISSLMGPFMQYWMMNRQASPNPTVPSYMAPKGIPDSAWGNTSVHTDSNPQPWGMGGAGFNWGTNPSYGSYSPSNNLYSGGK